jgi:prepilin signal peptidase PulO-like enzyme (type II secretory pathway)
MRMHGIIALLSLIGAAGVLVALSVIDLKVRLLPNKLVLTFAVLGFIFHLATLNAYLTLPEMALGAAIGFGSFYLIRFLANKYYQKDSLGLGDVKLMGAAGLWLGPEMVLMAMSAGALAGMLHGLAVGLATAQKTGQPLNLSTLEVPAGPGFALGIIAMGLYQFSDFRVHF